MDVESGGLQFMGSKEVRHNLVTEHTTFKVSTHPRVRNYLNFDICISHSLNYQLTKPHPP